jgi:hypothetical protein
VTVRLRQVVLAATDVDAVSAELRRELGLAAPWDRDPLAAGFGVRNHVYALGDRFLEVLGPLRDDAPAARHLRRHGDGGYMALFQIRDVAAARDRARRGGARVVWTYDAPDISATHLHPADTGGGALLSLDWADPPGSWRWAGTDWTGRAGTGAPGRVLGMTVEAPDPDALAARWAELLGVEAVPDVTFRRGDGGIVEVAVEVPDEVRRGRDAVEVGGVRFTLTR